MLSPLPAEPTKFLTGLAGERTIPAAKLASSHYFAEKTSVMPSFLLVLLAWLALAQVGPAPQPAEAAASTAPTLGLAETIALAVAAMSAEVGGIVVVFIAFAVQELRRESRVVTDEPDYRGLRDRSRLGMLIRSSAFSMLSLAASSLLGIFAAVTHLHADALVPWTVAFFTYGISCLLFAVAAYLVLEKPFLRATI